MATINDVAISTAKKRKRPVCHDFLGGGEPLSRVDTSESQFVPKKQSDRRLGLRDLFCGSFTCNPFWPPRTKIGKIEGKSFSSCSSRNGKQVSSSQTNGSEFFTFRLEHHKATIRNRDEERILLFRSDQPGSIGKIVFLCNAQNGNTTAAKIEVLSVAEAYRGLDFGGLLLSEALTCLQQRPCNKDSNPVIHCSLIAKEDTTRQGHLVRFYEEFGAAAKGGVARGSLVNNNDGEVYERVPMEIILQLANSACKRLFRNPYPFPNLMLAPFLPAVFCVRDILRHDLLPLTHNGESCAWLIVEQEHDEMFIQRTRHSFGVEESSWALFRLLPANESRGVLIESADLEKSGTRFWTVKSMTNDMYLDCNLETFNLQLSHSPAFWETQKNLFCLVKTVENYSLRDFYRRMWTKQTASYVEKMRQRYCTFSVCNMSIQEALEHADDIPAFPMEAGLSVRGLSFACAELARNEGHPDWVQFVALIRGLACVLKKHRSLLGSDDEFDWTFSFAESRVLGCKAVDCSLYSEFRSLNEDERDPRYNSYMGIYERSVGLENVLQHWSSGEYMYYMLQHNNVSLPPEAYQLLKLSSLVDWHSRGKYRELCKIEDESVKQSVADFFDICRRATEAATTRRIDKNAEDAEYQSLWSTHYSLVVRKYVGRSQRLSW